MGISVQEFKAAMETMKAKRLKDKWGTKYYELVPRFEVQGTEFLHSGSYYIVQSKHPVSQKVMNKAMSKLGESGNGRSHFWDEQIHSVLGILTLVAIMQDKYSKAFVRKCMNETYQKLFADPSIQRKIKKTWKEPTSEKMKQLQKLLKKFDKTINPFCNSDISLKEPIQYIDKIRVSVTEVELCLFAENVKTIFNNTSKQVGYHADVSNDEEMGIKDGEILIYHYFDKDQEGKLFNEGVFLSITSINECGELDEFELSINMKTGLVCLENGNKPTVPATEEQIAIMITHLKMILKKVNKTIITKMVDEK